MSQATAVHVIDDDAGVRKSLQMVMQAALLNVYVYDSAEQFLDEADLTSPGCIVMDLRMPGVDGLELLQRLRSTRNDMPVIMISGHADVPAAVRGMKLGAVDLLQKPFEPSVLLSLVKKSIDASVVLHRHRIEGDAVRQRFAALTPRERSLLKLVVSGRSNKQIAFDLTISIKTVANHRANLMAKTEALNGADLGRLSTIAGDLAADYIATLGTKAHLHTSSCGK
jgi:two-component system response regulator FixJ